MEDLDSINRRTFIRKTAGILLAGSAAHLLPLSVFGAASRNRTHSKDSVRITILHTNDLHSRIEPFPMDGSPYQGLGGAARRATLINQIRKSEKNVLLFDAGDMVQGTPYYNQFGGELEIRLMNKMGYDAATFGNHEFDNGLEQLAQMVSAADFPFLSSNYDLRDTVLNNKYQSYKIFEKQGVRIGVFGLGLDLNGKVDPMQWKGLIYNYPLAVANETASRLKRDLNCDLVICLSHLGHEYPDERISDCIVAKETYDIDLIIGGHTHTFMREPAQILNKSGNTTTIHQVGFGGIQLGRVDFEFDVVAKKKQLITAAAYPISTEI